MTALCHVAEPKNLFLAGTLHHSIYCIDSEVTPTGDPQGFTMPDQSMLDELLNKIQQLEEVNKLISKEDSYMKAISLTTRAHLLKDAFRISVKVYTGKHLSLLLILYAVYQLTELDFNTNVICYIYYLLFISSVCLKL